MFSTEPHAETSPTILVADIRYALSEARMGIGRTRHARSEGRHADARGHLARAGHYRRQAHGLKLRLAAVSA